MMHSSSRRNLGVLVLTLIVLVACKKTPPPKAERVPEPYTTTGAAVRFDIFPAGGSEGAQSWLASYTDGDRSTKFRIEMGLASAVQDRADMSSGVGRLVSEPGSDPTVLLASLKVALQAKHIPRSTVHADSLQFTYFLLGDHQTREPDGSFRESPVGNWIVTKILLGKGEVFLNLNPTDAVAEFSMKDPSQGDAVLGELAKVF
jgi:hypothetical protein